MAALNGGLPIGNDVIGKSAADARQEAQDAAALIPVAPGEADPGAGPLEDDMTYAQGAAAGQLLFRRMCTWDKRLLEAIAASDTETIATTKADWHDRSGTPTSPPQARTTSGRCTPRRAWVIQRCSSSFTKSTAATSPATSPGSTTKRRRADLRRPARSQEPPRSNGYTGRPNDLPPDVPESKLDAGEDVVEHRLSVELRRRSPTHRAWRKPVRRSSRETMTAVSVRGQAVDIEASVIEAAERGDQEAFAAMIRHYDSGLRAFAYRLLGDPDRMDDALREAYVKAYRALPRFRGASKLGTWLYRVAYNACLDEFERSRHIVQLPLAEAADPPDPGPGVAETVVRRRSLADALAELAPEDRAAVLLVDAQGFDYGAAGRCSACRKGRWPPTSTARGPRSAGRWARGRKGCQKDEQDNPTSYLPGQSVRRPGTSRPRCGLKGRR